MTIGCKTVAELFRLHGTGTRTRASRLWAGRSTCSPAGIPATSKRETTTIGATQLPFNCDLRHARLVTNGLMTRFTGVRYVVPPAFAIPNFSKIKSKITADAGRQVFAETLQFGCSPERHSARKSFSPARPRPNWRGRAISLASAHNVSESISPTQWSAPSRPSANVAMIWNTWSENPPMFKTSSRSAACTVA